MTPRRLIPPGNEAIPDPGYTAPSPPHLDDALRQVRVKDALLHYGSRASEVATRLLVALEVGAGDLEPADRPPGAPGVVAAVRAVGAGRLLISWARGRRAVDAEVGPGGSVAWEARDGGRPARTRQFPPGHPGAYDWGRRAMGWLLGRDDRG